MAEPLTFEEYEAGVACPGCGAPVRGPIAFWPGKPSRDHTAEERAEADAEEAAYAARHPQCRSPRWSVEGSGVLHCEECCPPPPLSPLQSGDLAELLAEMLGRRPH